MGANGSAQARYAGQAQYAAQYGAQYGAEYGSGAEVAAYGGYQQQAGMQQQYGGQASEGPGGPLGVSNNPNMVWDEARGGYWVKETVVNDGQINSDSSGYGSSGAYGSGDGYTVYGGQPGKIIRRTKQCCEPEPCDQNIVIHNHKKIVHVEPDCDDEITIIAPPQPPIIVNCPPPQPAPPTNIFLIQPSCPCPEKPKARGPTAFFPEVRERSYKLETQTKTSGCMSGPCGGAMMISCGPCGGRAGPACSRCSSYH